MINSRYCDTAQGFMQSTKNPKSVSQYIKTHVPKCLTCLKRARGAAKAKAKAKK